MGGFFGTVQQQPCINDLFYGTDYHSHLGTKRAGLCTYSPASGFTRTIHSLERDYFRSRFEPELEQYEGNSGIGVISDTDPQPILINSHLGRYAVVTVGKINNLRDIAATLLSQGHHFSEMSANNINPTELVALLINTQPTFTDGIRHVHRTIRGSLSMLILTEDGIIAARDALGRTPINIARRDTDHALAAATETSALPNLGYTPQRDLGPGEIVRLTEGGTITTLQPPYHRCQICSFLWVYYGFPASDYQGINTEAVREQIGRTLGSTEPSTTDCVCGIPDSGVGTALGYAEGNHTPYQRAVLKYTPTWPRSFTPGNQSRRNLVAKMKLIPNRALLQDRAVTFCDDSIVRGTQLRDNARNFLSYGAREVHVRISCPPLVYGCPYIGFTASKSDYELFTRQIIRDIEGPDRADQPDTLSRYADHHTKEHQQMVAEIARRLTLNSLRFATIDTLVSAIGLPKDQICTHCFDGTSYDYADQPEQ